MKGEFLKCSEQLEASGQPEWKENCLYIAKCFIEKRDSSGNIQHWLKKGSCLPNVDEEVSLSDTDFTITHLFVLFA